MKSSDSETGESFQNNGHASDVKVRRFVTKCAGIFPVTWVVDSTGIAMHVTRVFYTRSTTQTELSVQVGWKKKSTSTLFFLSLKQIVSVRTVRNKYRPVGRIWRSHLYLPFLDLKKIGEQVIMAESSPFFRNQRSCNGYRRFLNVVSFCCNSIEPPG